jgi:hypothetical protein
MTESLIYVYLGEFQNVTGLVAVVYSFTVKKFIDFLYPSRDVTDQTLLGQE